MGDVMNLWEYIHNRVWFCMAWYSICSMHFINRDNCPNCHRGNWGYADASERKLIREGRKKYKKFMR